MKHRLFGHLADAIKNNDLRYYKELLEENLTELRYLINENNNVNIFHEIVSSRIYEKDQIEFVQKTVDLGLILFGEDNIRALVNSKSDDAENLTPLHLAIFKKKMYIAKKYLELGADPEIETNLKQNSLHIAARMNQFYILLNLVKYHNMSLDQVDIDKHTPLQLAIKEKYEDMALLIISLSQEADIKKTAALSMAVASKSYKITKHLLINVKFEPLDIQASSKQCQDKDISKLLNKSGKVRKYSRFTLLVFGLLFKESFRIVQFFFFKSQLHFLVIFEIFAQFGLFFCVFIALLSVTLKNPGFEKQSKLSLIELYEKYRSEFVCPYCMSKKHKNTRHCTVCKKCVVDHDHHCLWINSCIGKNNYWNFIVFLILLALDLLFDLSVYLFDIITYHKNIISAFKGTNTENIEFYLLTIGMLSNFIVLFIMAPISFKQFINLKNYLKRKKRENYKNKNLSNILLLKDIPPPINDSTSDTASMFIRESIESQGEISSLIPEY